MKYTSVFFSGPKYDIGLTGPIPATNTRRKSEDNGRSSLHNCCSEHGIMLRCKKAIVATSIKYYRAKGRLSLRAWNSEVQKGECRHTRAWNITLQKGDCRRQPQILQCKKAIVATHEHGLLQCKNAIVATSMGYCQQRQSLTSTAFIIILFRNTQSKITLLGAPHLCELELARTTSHVYDLPD